MGLLVPSRRSFIGGLLSALAAPAIVHIGNIMPVKAMVPFGPFIGEIKPIVGAIPDGWVECNGQWVVSMACSELHRSVMEMHLPTNEEEQKNWTTVPDLFFVPNLSEQARIERENGAMIGRYMIYAGKQAIEHRKSILRHMPFLHDEGSPVMCDHSYSIGERV